LPGSFYHGRVPLRKYKTTWPIHSRSSLLDCSFPKCVAILAYLAVPVKFFPSTRGMCVPSEFLYYFDKPKSMI